jgi:hypothetical protein
MHTPASPLPPMPLTASQRLLLAGLRVFLGILAVFAIIDFIANLRQ